MGKPGYLIACGNGMPHIIYCDGMSEFIDDYISVGYAVGGTFETKNDAFDYMLTNLGPYIKEYSPTFVGKEVTAEEYVGALKEKEQQKVDFRNAVDENLLAAINTEGSIALRTSSYKAFKDGKITEFVKAATSMELTINGKKYNAELTLSTASSDDIPQIGVAVDISEDVYEGDHHYNEIVVSGLVPSQEVLGVIGEKLQNGQIVFEAKEYSSDVEKSVAAKINSGQGQIKGLEPAGKADTEITGLLQENAVLDAQIATAEQVLGVEGTIHDGH